MSETTIETPGAPEPAAPEQAPEPAASAEPAEPQDGQPEPKPEPSDVTDLPPWAQKQLRDIRAEAARYRTSAKGMEEKLTKYEQTHKQQMDGIAKALGLAPDEATPEQIMAERDAERANAEAERRRARQAAVELATYRAAATLGADGNALLDSRSFVRAIEGLDPSGDDFAQRVKDAITEALEAHPEWKAAPSARPEPPSTVPPQPKPEPTIPRANGQFTGAPAGPRQWTDDDVARATAQQVVQAMRDGLLQNLGAGTGHGRDRRVNAQ
jgi:hypothetical protein